MKCNFTHDSDWIGLVISVDDTTEIRNLVRRKWNKEISYIQTGTCGNKNWKMILLVEIVLFCLDAGVWNSGEILSSRITETVEI